MIDSDCSMYLTADSLIEINNIITGSSGITLIKVNVKPCGFDKTYMDKDLIEDSPYQTIYQFKEKKITATKIYSRLLNKIHPLYDGSGRMCKSYCLVMILK